MLAALRGVVPQEVTLDDIKTAKPPAAAEPELQQTPDHSNLKAEAQRLDKAVAEALSHNSKDSVELASLAQELDRLIDLAIDHEDPDSFYVLAARRGCVKAHIRG